MLAVEDSAMMTGLRSSGSSALFVLVRLQDVGGCRHGCNRLLRLQVMVLQPPLVAPQPLFQVPGGGIDGAMRIAGSALSVERQPGGQVQGDFALETGSLLLDDDNVSAHDAVEVFCHVAAEPVLDVLAQARRQYRGSCR